MNMAMYIGLNAHLLSHQAGYRSAGIHTYIHQLLLNMPQLAPDDWRFTAMVGGANDAIYDGITMKRARLDTESPTKRILWEQVLQPSQLHPFDLYHALAFVAPVLLTKPMVVTVYDLTFMRYPQRLTTVRRLYLRHMTELTCKRARRILAISQSTADDLNSLLKIPAHKIDVTPLGYDRDRYQPLPQAQVEDFRQKHELPERFWFYLGTIEPRKNLVTLLDAYAQLPESERLPLYIGGGLGWKTDDFFAAIKRHQLEESVIRTGFIPDEDIALWYNAADVFLYPSVFEGFGLPVLEAMACGTPVVTSNVSSLPEVADGAGLCLPPHDTTAWTETLRSVYHDAAWRQAAREAGLQKAQQFRWETTAQQTLDSYRRAMI